MMTTLGDLLYNVFDDDKKEERYFDSQCDVIAISCAVQRCQYKNPQAYVSISSLLSNVLVNKMLLAEDYEKAKKIREYYQLKNTFWVLTNKNKSKFRQDLAEFLAQDTVKYKHSLIGLIYSLPFFYDYDLKLYDLSQQFNLKGITRHKGEMQLDYVGNLCSNLRSNSLKEFWFTNENKQPVMIPVASKNPLMSVWYAYLEKSNTITLTGRFIVKTDRDFPYLAAEKWDLKMVDK